MSSVPVDANSLFQVPGLVAVITGGGTGLGLMMARALATNGAKRVYIAGRRLDKLQAAASTHPDILIPVVCDVTSKDSLAALSAKVKEEVGYVNLVVCNSGVSGPGVGGLGANAKDSAVGLQKAIWDAWSMEDFTATFNVNCTAVFFTAIAFLDLLDLGNKPENRAGGVLSQIVITGSIASYIRLVVSGFAYVGSKAAVLQMMKAMATYLAPFQIRTNAICPGFFASEMTQDMLPVIARAQTGDPTRFNRDFCPAERAGEEQEMAGTILYMASKAGGYLDGCSIMIDGGRLSILPSSY